MLTYISKKFVKFAKAFAGHCSGDGNRGGGHCSD